jgi:spore germination cell wall hydrolase CwlJ-like protein
LDKLGVIKSRTIAMNKIQIVALAALLTGCAQTPQTKVDADGGYRPVESAGEVAGQPQLSARSIETPAQLREPIFQAPPRKPVDAQDQQCLAEALYWEARGEGEDGMLAVASVIFNRVEDERFPDTVCDVIYDGGETPPCQFSWWCDGKSDEPTNQAKWWEINSLAYDYLAISPEDPTDGALFYHADSIKTPWRRQLTARIGNHIFYR